MEEGKEPSSGIRSGPLLGDTLLRMHLNTKMGNRPARTT